MFLSDFDAKRIHLQALAWSGLLFILSRADDEPGSYTTSEVLVLGAPSGLTTTSTWTSTITITTTISYSLTIAPGDSNYTLLGCYSQPTGNGGEVFGPDGYDACSDMVPSENLTVDSCLEGCGSLAPPNNASEVYTYAGLRNGSECMCGIQISNGANNVTTDDCQTPCPGDPMIFCGGSNNIIVYSLISKAGQPTGGRSSSISNARSSTKKSGASTNSQSQHESTTTSASKSSTSKTGTQSDTTGATATAQTTKHPSTLPASAGPGTSARPVSAPTVAAITGSFSGAILLGAGLFLCLRWHRRKKRMQEIHVKAMLEGRGETPPDAMILTMTTSHNHDDIAVVADDVRVRRKSKDADGERDLRLTTEGDLVPTTPALESGGRFPPGLHARGPAGGGNSGTGPGTGGRPMDDRDSLYNSLLHEVRAGPAGSSSAVQWRRANQINITAKDNTASSAAPPSTTHRRTVSTGIASPPPPAKIEAPLGERAWHRRKLSTSFQPPSSGNTSRNQPNPEAIGVAIGTKRNIARTGPPSSPPKAPLPPTPQGGRTSLRPQRSFDLAAEPTIPDLDNSQALDKSRALGMSHANASTPTLGRFGSISRRPTVESAMESPVLGRAMYLRVGGNNNDGRSSNDKPRASPEVKRGPWLPPVAPGARFDHKSWRGTIYDPRHDDDGNREEGDSPLSASSVGTSLLYDKTEFDRGR
ncbi:hypothetical protein F5Y16DRAFT_162390 [Xylariaceae sp. FL0255]|nr:hypothetical protein F5Y16DRAFT_162390 [Xylariaceae sp. FL0255]